VSLFDELRALIRALDAAGVEYALAGRPQDIADIQNLKEVDR
jgi:hypothetical protein